MKTVKYILAALSCTFAFATSAHAIPITVDSTVTNYQLDASKTNNSISLDFNINALLASFNASLNDINSAMLTFIFSDPNKGSETYTISVAMNGQTVSSDNSNSVNNGGTKTEPILLNTASLGDLKADGMISALVTAKTGEFYIDSASLTAEVTPTAVPEPATLALLGMGLLGVGAMRRRRS